MSVGPARPLHCHALYGSGLRLPCGAAPAQPLSVHHAASRVPLRTLPRSPPPPLDRLSGFCILSPQSPDLVWCARPCCMYALDMSPVCTPPCQDRGTPTIRSVHPILLLSLPSHPPFSPSAFAGNPGAVVLLLFLSAVTTASSPLSFTSTIINLSPPSLLSPVHVGRSFSSSGFLTPTHWPALVWSHPACIQHPHRSFLGRISLCSHYLIPGLPHPQQVCLTFD